MILVTGATGRTGREVIRELVSAGAPVCAFVRDAGAAASIFGPGVETRVGDLDHPETLRAAMHGVDKLFLLTPVDPRQVEQQGHAVEIARQAGVRHIVKMSALGAAPDSPICLARWHAETERQIEDSGIPFTHLRPHWFMQNACNFAPSIVAEGRFYAPMRDAAISMVDCRDVAAVAARILIDGGHERRTYDVTGPEPVSFRHVATALSAAIGKPVEYVDVPPAEAEKQMVAAGMPDWLADALNGLYGIFSAGHASQVSPVVMDVVGRPARTFEEFAVDYTDAFA